jgi:hypothetical protein
LKDGQLMRTLKLLVLVVLFVAGAALPVHAQAPAAPAAPAPQEQTPAPAAPQEQTPPPTQPPQEQTPAPAPAPQTPVVPLPSPQPASEDDSRFFFTVSIGGQSMEQTFSDSSTFSIYNERGAIASAHSIGGGTLFDVSVGAKVWKNVGIGIANSTLTNKNDATVSVRVPHPLIFGQSRTATATAADLKHSENVVHLQFMWFIPLTSKFQLAVMAGPSFFTVRQTVATVQAPQDIRDVAPFTTVTINSVTLTEVKDSPVGVNVGVDGTYFIRTIKGMGIGVGGFVRYAGASLDLPISAGVTRDTELETGGPQGAIGLRLRF